MSNSKHPFSYCSNDPVLFGFTFFAGMRMREHPRGVREPPGQREAAPPGGLLCVDAADTKADSVLCRFPRR